MARPFKCRCICSKPETTCFVPENADGTGRVVIGYDEYEVIRLLDYVALTQEQCAEKMNVSRPTVTRMYDSARRKMADALVNGKKICIEGGDVAVCTAMKPQCAHEKYCCLRNKDKQV
ncbi:DUF134 domain-containing protein [Christensenella intestinihominis]|uniref:DUF134 domain-containing protein n=1 Tax=Christensenella intestinihominis TaxID=1851429 RepID=UPI000830C6BE|nr:DUF134 domain-containing protein [Christensenella intestinihominis]